VMQRAFPDASLPDSEDQITTIADGLLCIGSRYTGDFGFDLIGELPERSSARQKIVAAGATVGQLDDLEVRRVRAGRPRWGADLDESVIPLEANLGARMISQGKGCYTGQEVIIRILHRGHVNRNLRRIRTDAPVPAKGTALFDATGKQIGTVTSAISTNGQVHGLAYVRRELPLPGTVSLGTVDGPKVEVFE
jgi:tRNA-modifying protein YgfZ